MIEPSYEAMLKQSSLDLQKEAIKHEYDWHGYADKMEERTK